MVVTVAVLTAILAVFGSILYADLGATMLDTTASNLDTTARAAALQEQHTTFASNPAGGGNNRPPPPAAGQPDGQRRVDGIFLPPLNGGEALFYSTLVDNLTSPGLSASVIDPSGAIVANGPAEQPFPTTPSPTLLPAVYQQVVAAHQSRHLRVQTANGAELVELIPLVQPVRGSITVVGVLQLNTSLRLVDSLLDRLRLLLIAGTLLAAVATVTLIIPLIRAVLAPLGRMAATSRAIAAGDLHQRVTEAESHDELADLAAAFNDMVDRLASLLASQRRFLADASHELRTPLTALAGGMEMLVLGADRADPAARARLLRLLQGEVERMGRLVDDLMTLTRLDARGKAALTLAVVDIRTLAEQVVEETRLLAPDMNVKADVPKAPVTVLGDADRLHQVLLNLVTNARAHMAPSGTITLSVLSSQDADQRGQARLAVTDTGEGIAPDHLPHIFDRFYRADQARERQGGGGLGLGLAIVRAIVENHGGTVEITSALDVGTTVTVILPTVRTVVAAQPALQTAS
ncbi:MAG TPA: HAMP domain-containing sensor histidine kinase [Chloroflexota bacterium]